ncbi:hypothetical protein K432DRAFT_382593 [Lepidopterella palustris CBS 459.81]|uniref:DUF7923 domain-containing protein n=1 Tax=Lepidopterella palustris CBS 459.81 TaxID=1314670 RepID=A0A8E2E9N7_9PEZI|nr:hypothetical protein K432DRAFT_382593 [Lepidopterella palustris CBS 459.81]
MAEAQVPQVQVPQVPDTYRGRLAQFRILEESRHALIEELLDKLEKTEAKLQQTELDLHSEQNVRRRLQSEVVEARDRETALAEKASRRPYIIVLIDADAEGFIFHDRYITKGTKGGESAADEMLVKVRDYLRPLHDDLDKLDIMVRIFANLEGMANMLVREGKLRNLGQLRAFSTGFSSRIPFFDFVDVGIGKEGGSGRKVRENLHFHASSHQCRHILLGSSPNDASASLLQNIASDTTLTLIESAPLPSSIKSLNLKSTKLATLFTSPPPKTSSSRTGRPQLQLTSSRDDPNSTWLVIRPERSKSQGAGGDDTSSSLSISIGPDNTVSFGREGRDRRRIMG